MQSYFSSTVLALTSTAGLIFSLNVILMLFKMKVHHCLSFCCCLNLKSYIKFFLLNK